MTAETIVLPEADLLVDSEPATGRFHMAMDAALLELGAERDRSVIRIYQWSEPTVTLGYFQNEWTSQGSPFPELPSVRRLTGGGAILHDRELTYSCVVPSSHPIRQNPSLLYEIVHRGIIALLDRCGVPSCLRKELAIQENPPQKGVRLATTIEPFLCFLRTNPNDIAHRVSGVKIVGSAQRRRRGVTLQHGSILLRASGLTRMLSGISEMSPGFDEAQFRQELPVVIARCVSDRWVARDFSSQELEMAENLMREAAT